MWGKWFFTYLILVNSSSSFIHATTDTTTQTPLTSSTSSSSKTPPPQNFTFSTNTTYKGFVLFSNKVPYIQCQFRIEPSNATEIPLINLFCEQDVPKDTIIQDQSLTRPQVGMSRISTNHHDSDILSQVPAIQELAVPLILDCNKSAIYMNSTRDNIDFIYNRVKQVFFLFFTGKLKSQIYERHNYIKMICLCITFAALVVIILIFSLIIIFHKKKLIIEYNFKKKKVQESGSGDFSNIPLKSRFNAEDF